MHAGQQQQQQQLEAKLVWHTDHSRVLIRHWADGSSFNKEAAAMAAAAAAVAPDGAKDTQCGGAPRASQHSVAGGVEQCDAAAEQHQDLPDKAHSSPQAQGEAQAAQ